MKTYHRSVWILGVGASVILLAAFLLTTNATPALATPKDLDRLMNKKYRMLQDTRLDSCRFCHNVDDDYTLNPYGQDYKDHGRTYVALEVIEPLDSDKDGFTNIEEIYALTFPGNPDDYPVPDIFLPLIVK